MKTFIITTITFLAFSITCNAQWTLTSGNIYTTTLTNNVGIGTSTPAAKLDVNGAQRLNGDLTFAADVTAYLIHGPGNGGAIRIRSNIVNAVDRNVQFGRIDNNGTWASFMTVDQTGYVGIGTTTPGVPFHIVKSPAAFTDIPVQEWDPSITGYNLTLSNYNSVHGIDYRFTQLTNGVPSSVLTFQGGNVGIGTVNPDTKLAVQGTIHSTSVVVDNLVPTPDYVFKSDYKLPTLSEIKTYTDKNHHLPGVPAAAEMEKNGINLGEMNMTLLKKVEELTLYLIEKDKNDQVQKAAITSLQDQISQLKTQINSQQRK
ncbi:hypothetical protein [Mucilaginibacter sp. OK098]|uniref:hypothetical protein n=1 Tax=Mucilaginibacter sp. OK098 TaxID=1855297 RepID=UPI00091E4CDA|nr:hypothetical protein [Mucilaginibacter sp. OK098]SHM16797.1 hypothetical protein SAMN05216524_1011036 [Mucilaginibacter sp. OK098]